MTSAETVDQYLGSLDTPARELVDAVRDIIRQSHPDLTEHIKWNAPSFRAVCDLMESLGIPKAPLI